MQPANQNEEQRIETRLRAILTVWFALLLSVGLYFMVTLFTGNPHEFTTEQRLFLAFAGRDHFWRSSRFPSSKCTLGDPSEQQSRTGSEGLHCRAGALSEVAALLGLLDLFLTGNRRYYVLFIVAVCGLLLHFPRRQHCWTPLLRVQVLD